MTLADLKIGQDAVLRTIGGQGELRHHLLDMGLTPGTEVTLRKVAPMGDPIEVELRGYELTLRLDDAAKIEVENVHETDRAARSEERHTAVPHPGVGELRKAPSYHDRKSGAEIPKGQPLRFALAGNQNCGKTTLFNQLTGSNQHVGNFPGVTVDRKDGVIRGHAEATVTDLPGIYSLSPYSSEEIVTRDFLLNTHPDGIINIVDASNIERNLYLTMQLMELNIPLVLALNMMDEVRANGGTIMVNELEELLGVPVVPISAAKNEGIDELVEHALHVARHRETPGRIDFCDAGDGAGGAVHRCVHAVSHLIEDHAARTGLPLRFAATKLVEGDTLIESALDLDANETELLGHTIAELESETGLDREAALADMRFNFIERLCNKTVVRPGESREHKRSVAIDRILTGKYTALPCFIGIMALVFWLTFGVIGAGLSDLLTLGIDALTDLTDHALTVYGINPVVHSLVIDGIFAGVGSVLSFLPTIVTLFFFLSILEDTGYMARVAFVMDQLLRRIGLSGRSFVPMLIGFGCSVPAIMGARTMENEKDRRMTILLVPFMSCSAKLPVYGLLSSAFFGPWAGLVVFGLYVIGMAAGILSGLLFKHTLFAGEPAPFVLELPPYRLPSLHNMLTHVWQKVKGFLIKAGTLILLMSILLWLLQSFDFSLHMVENEADSMLGALGSVIAPIFKPLGFGFWQAAVALLTGLIAKEMVVSSLSMFYAFPLTATGAQVAAAMTGFTPLSAFSMLVFILLYVPCVAAVSTLAKEMNSTKWTLFSIGWQLGVAYVASLLVYQVGSLFL